MKAHSTASWAAEFVQYNVSVVDGELALGENARRWDVTARWMERGLLGPAMVDASSVWVPSALSADGQYPQEVRLMFETGRVVVISAFEQRGGGLTMGMVDHLTVFFDEAEANRLVHGDGSPR